MDHGRSRADCRRSHGKPLRYDQAISRCVGVCVCVCVFIIVTNMCGLVHVRLESFNYNQWQYYSNHFFNILNSGWKGGKKTSNNNDNNNNHVSSLDSLAGVPGVKAERLEEANHIRHCALSLVGEPIMWDQFWWSKEIESERWWWCVCVCVWVSDKRTSCQAASK